MIVQVAALTRAVTALSKANKTLSAASKISMALPPEIVPRGGAEIQRLNLGRSVPEPEPQKALLAARETVGLTRPLAPFPPCGEGQAMFASQEEPESDPLQTPIERLEREVLERQRAEMALRRSEELLRTSFDALGDWIQVVDPDLRIVLVNKAFRQMAAEYGLSSQPIGRTPFELFPFLPDHVRDEYLRVFETGEPLITQEATAAGSMEIFTETRKIPVIEEGCVTRVITIMRDITERKQAENALRLSEDRFRSFVEQSHDGIRMADQNGRVTLWNQASEEITGLKREDVLGRYLWDVLFQIVPDEDRTPALLDRIRAAFLDRLAGDETVPHRDVPERTLQRPDGTRRTVQLTDFRVQTCQGSMFATTVRDRTDLIQAAEKTIQLALEQERSTILSTFIQDVSHEFGNPLSVIKNDLYLIDHLPDPDRRERHLASIRGQVFHVERLVKGLLTMAQLDRGLDLDTAPVDLNALLGIVQDGLSSAAQEKGHTLRLDLAPDLPPVWADQRYLYQALNELARNAVLFTPPGGTITLRSLVGEDRIVVEVIDTGIGISAENLPRVFERFFRVDKARAERGAGLGLSIAQAIIDAHRGRIEVESAPGVGSTFRVFLPNYSA